MIINLFDKASKVQVMDDTCDDCGSQTVTVEYKEVSIILVCSLALLFSVSLKFLLETPD